MQCHRRPRCPEAIPSRDGVIAKQASACKWAGLLIVVLMSALNLTMHTRPLPQETSTTLATGVVYLVRLDDRLGGGDLA